MFGNYVDVYDISQAVEDGATVKIYYESRLAKIALRQEGKKLVAELDKELEEEDLAEAQKAKAKWTQLEALNPEDELKLVIVRDMWLTGFDVPCLHTMYIDKPMKDHTLMQAIATETVLKQAELIADELTKRG